MHYVNAATNPLAKTNLIIVMGVSGSGKTSIAQALAKTYGYQFLDADDFHSAHSRALMAEGIPLTETQRAPWAAKIKAALEHNGSQGVHTCLAFSGLKKHHRDLLRSAGLRTLFIHLHGNLETIQARVNARKGHFMAPALLQSQFDALEATDTEPDVVLVSISPSLSEVLDEIRAHIGLLLT